MGQASGLPVHHGNYGLPRRSALPRHCRRLWRSRKDSSPASCMRNDSNFAKGLRWLSRKSAQIKRKYSRQKPVGRSWFVIKDELELTDPFSDPPYQKTGEKVVRLTPFYSFKEYKKSGVTTRYHLKVAYMPESQSGGVG